MIELDFRKTTNLVQVPEHDTEVQEAEEPDAGSHKEVEEVPASDMLVAEAQEAGLAQEHHDEAVDR